MKKRKIVGICSSVGNKAKATNNTYPIIFINRIFIEISHSYNLIPIILSPTVDISEIEQMANMIDFLILTGGEDIGQVQNFFGLNGIGYCECVGILDLRRHIRFWYKIEFQ